MQKADQFTPQVVVIGVLNHLQALAGPGKGHVKNLADLRFRAIGHHHHPVGKQQGLIHVMGNHYGGDTSFLADLHQLLLQIAASEGIEGPKRFVQKQQTGSDRKSPGYCHPLLHTAREFSRQLVGSMAEANHLDTAINGLFALRDRTGGHDAIDRQGHVLANGLPRQQGIVLEHHHAIWAWLFNLASVDQNATTAGLGKASQEIKQGALATTGVTNQRNKFTLSDFKVDVLESDVMATIFEGKDFGDIINGKEATHLNDHPEQLYFQSRPLSDQGLDPQAQHR